MTKLGFLWLGCHNSTPTYDVMHRRRMLQSNTCTICMNDNESSIFFNHTNSFNFLKSNAIGDSSSIFLAGICWTWRARNPICIAKESCPIFKLTLVVHSLNS